MQANKTFVEEFDLFLGDYLLNPLPVEVIPLEIRELEKEFDEMEEQLKTLLKPELQKALNDLRDKQAEIKAVSFEWFYRRGFFNGVQMLNHCLAGGNGK